VTSATDDTDKNGSVDEITSRFLAVRGGAMAADYPVHVEKERMFNGTIAKGASGMSAKRVQEWVTYHGFATPVDGDFGPATEGCVEFQSANGLSSTGTVNAQTWEALVEPLNKAQQLPKVKSGDSLDEIILKVA
jgi:peptidoglycan hydrolase-like protein with peptidoglycan-binding domain